MSGGFTDMGDPLYDPDRHDNQLVAVFEYRGAADRAREALLGAGIPEGAIEVLDADPSGEASAGTALRQLFAPEQEYDDYRHALGRGHAMVVVTPIGGTDRHRAIEVLDASDPLDFDAKRAEWRASGNAVPMNRAAVTRAALIGKAPTGRDAVMLDMTGQPMRVKSMSAEDMEAAAESPRAPSLTSAHHDVPAAEPAAPTPAEPALPRQTTYTYGVPQEVANELRHEPPAQLQQPARARIGRREQRPGAVQVRSYLAERQPADRPARLDEEQIGNAGPRT